MSMQCRPKPKQQKTTTQKKGAPKKRIRVDEHQYQEVKRVSQEEAIARAVKEALVFALAPAVEKAVAQQLQPAIAKAIQPLKSELFRLQTQTSAMESSIEALRMENQQLKKTVERLEFEVLADMQMQIEVIELREGRGEGEEEVTICDCRCPDILKKVGNLLLHETRNE